MTTKELEKIAHDLISDKLKAGEIVQMEWAVYAVIKKQGKISGAGLPFYMLCAREHVYRIVKKAVDKYEQPEVDDQQMILEGYDCLQEAYTVERDEERTLVPIELISDSELLSRAKEFRKQAAGLVHHADEIVEYIEKRRASKAASA
jgi:hypothetical protein